MTTTNQYIGGFLITEGGLSLIFSNCKSPMSQLGRLIRISLGIYIYTKH